MKRWVILGIGFLLLLIVIFSFKIAEKGNPIGEATIQAVGLNITVIGSPNLIIINPKNQTYLTWQDLKFNFTAQNADYIWYKLDSSSNQSLNSPTNINLTQGSHTLHLYANNSHGETGKNVTFNINFSFFIIKDDHYEENDDHNETQGIMSRNEKKGESTDFLDYSYEELQNLSDLIIHDPNRGKIKFNEAINITNDSNPSDNVLDLNSYTNVSFNRIEINTTTLPNFNKTATLTIYNLIFSNPRISRDGIVCPESVCKIASYSNGILVFNVTHFSSYSAEETPVSSSSSARTAAESESGGRIKETLTFENLTFYPEKISVVLEQGKAKEEKITVTNTGTKRLGILMINENSKELVNLETTRLDLDVNESRNVTVYTAINENTAPKAYTGKITIKTQEIWKQIPVSIEVQAKKQEYKEIKAIKYEWISIFLAIGVAILTIVILYKISKLKKKPRRKSN